MARVCRDWFPETDGFYMDDNLKTQMDVMIKNVVKDWDFTVLISGQGEMRVGKSLLGMQLGSYWTHEMWRVHKIKVPFNVEENIVFNGVDIVRKGMALGNKYNYAVLDYDEAADDMEGVKVMRGSAQKVKDYLRKAAQFNMLNIINQSEYFELPKYLAISRSTCLIDITYTADDYGNFKRGYGRFFSRRTKKRLYLLGKKMLDYNAVKPDFKFTFPNFYPVDEKEYRAEKRKSLMSWEKTSAMEQRRNAWLTAAFKILHGKKELGGFEWSYTEIARRIKEIADISITDKTVAYVLEYGKTEEDV